MKKIKFLLIPFLAILCLGCDKSFLDKKPNKALLVPETISDLQAILDNPSVMNVAPGISVFSADDFVNTGSLNDLINPFERTVYLWEENVYNGVADIPDWSSIYTQVLYANIVLEGIEKLNNIDRQGIQGKNIEGGALFFRGRAFLSLLDHFSFPYNQSVISSPGIVIRTQADVTKSSFRSTIGESYQQAENDLLAAYGLLSNTVQVKNRPGKRAAGAMLARLYLHKGDYERADRYASECLAIDNQLLDYNTLNAGLANPFPLILPNGNPEAILYSIPIGYSIFFSSQTIVDPALFSMYASNDLRRSLFFNATGNFRGSYVGNTNFFTGLSNDELYLIVSECRVRKGDISGAVQILNTLLEKRFRTGSFVPVASTSPSEFLKIVLNERRKELVGRGTRWLDLRRLNQDPAYSTTLTRRLGNTIYTLLPGSNRYTFPIPDNEVLINGLVQNPR